MKRNGLFLFAFLFVFATMASADTVAPQCQLGTQWAVDPSRQLADGEEIFKLPASRVVTISQREKPGSSRIVWRRCSLPAGTQVIRGGATEWVKVCGNTILAEGEALRLALRGEIGPQGPQGPRGFTGEPGKDLTPIKRPLCGESWRTGRRWACVAVAAIVVGAAASQGGGDDKEKVTTLPPCTSLPCN